MTVCQMCTKWHDEPNFRIAMLDRCHVMLNPDQFFPGYCFVFTRSHVTELFHLDPAVRTEVMGEVSAVAAALDRVFNPTKINYELLGNMVPHMHWHIIPRFSGDPLWPRPIWSEAHDPVELTAEGYTARITKIKAGLEQL